MSDNFNAAQFLDDVQGDAVESKFTPVPTGDYAGGLDGTSITVEKVTFGNGDEGARFRAKWKLDGEIGGMKTPTVRQDFLLDISGFDANGKPILKTGANQNIRLGRLIALSGQKPDGWTYRGLGAARGLVKVTHRADKRDADTVYAEVSAVAPL